MLLIEQFYISEKLIRNKQKIQIEYIPGKSGRIARFDKQNLG